MRSKGRLAASVALAFLLGAGCRLCAQQVRIRDIAQPHGPRYSQLMGYGLVVGMGVSGDSQRTMFAAQSVARMLAGFGVNVPPGAVKAGNVAAVMVTADLPTFSRAGGQIDVVISSLGDARSLQGGALLRTPLKGADGQVYAVAQGSVSVGGPGMGGGGDATRGNPTIGRIPAGAVIEKQAPVQMTQRNELLIDLTRADYTTASRAAAVMNARLGSGLAKAVDGSCVSVSVPARYRENIVGLVAEIGDLTIE